MKAESSYWVTPAPHPPCCCLLFIFPVCLLPLARIPLLGLGHTVFQYDPSLADHTHKTLTNQTYEVGTLGLARAFSLTSGIYLWRGPLASHRDCLPPRLF